MALCCRLMVMRLDENWMTSHEALHLSYFLFAFHSVCIGRLLEGHPCADITHARLLRSGETSILLQYTFLSTQDNVFLFGVGHKRIFEKTRVQRQVHICLRFDDATKVGDASSSCVGPAEERLLEAHGKIVVLSCSKTYLCTGQYICESWRPNV